MKKCNKIANDIVRRGGEDTYIGIRIYKGGGPSNYFSITHGGATVYSIYNKIYKVEICNPRGIVHFNLRLWLMEIDRKISKMVVRLFWATHTVYKEDK